MQFVGPEAVAGKTEYETENLRVRVALPAARVDPDHPLQPFIASLIVENKRPVMAHIDAGRSCLIDPEHGAANIAMTDPIIPPNGWVRLSRAIYAMVTVNVNWFGSGSWDQADRVPPVGARQRVLLTVRWEDERTEDLDLSYEIIPRAADEVQLTE